MPRNLIVTCGTSQIETRRIQKAMNAARASKTGREWSSEQKKWKKLLDYAANVQEPAEGITDDLILQVIGQGGQLTEEGQYCETLLSGLVKKWEGINSAIGTPANPFGAEISTLYKMATAPPPLFSPNTDSIVLLYSDTPGGAFCAGLLYRLLTHQQVYNMPQSNITHKRIPELREQPRNVTKAEDYTRIALLEARKEQEGVENIFVMTGGFKSTLPILIVIALLHGDPIYYLFERSKELRQVDPQATVQSPQRWWLFRILQREKREDKTSVTLTVKTGKGKVPAVPEPQTP